jgi:hypothetical protein
MIFRSRKQSRKLGSRKKLAIPPIERSQQGVGELAAVVIVKDEGVYIEEWLEFHRLMGCGHFYVYDNGSRDDTLEILGRYARQGLVTLTPWPRFDRDTGPQIYAYAHALCTYGPQWRWMTFLDADEFLYPVAADSLTEALRDYDDVPAIAVPWRMFGFSGHETRPAGTVIENYVMRAPFPPPPEEDELLKVKCIVDPTCVSRVVGVHMFDLNTGARSAFNERKEGVDYKTYKDRKLIADDVFRLNHYFTRSKEDFQRKVVKGSAARPTTEGDGVPGDLAAERRVKFSEMIERNPIEDRAIQRFVPPLERALAVARS